jgi:predicted permease
MSIVDSLRYRWRVWTSPRAHETELSEEMDFHVGLETMQREHAGHGVVPPREARDAARRRFGNRTYYREEARRAAGLGGLDALAQDVRFGIRTFRRAPTFTAVAVLTLAVGIGATTAIFSAVSALLLRPLPFPVPERLMSISLTLPARGGRPELTDAAWSYPQFAMLRDGQTVFAAVSLWRSSQFTLRISDEAERVAGEMVDAQFFPVLGVRPVIGRVFSPDDDRPGAARTVMISDELWQRLFNHDPLVLGKTVAIDDGLFAIIGVLPPTFQGLSGQVSFWFPIVAAPPAWGLATVTAPDFRSYYGIGRLRPGVSYERATAMVRQLAPRIDAAYPISQIPGAHWSARATPLDAARVDHESREALFILLGAVALVLLVACANVAGLFLARAASRRREIAVRLAIGAGRGRLVRQLLVESGMLAAIGGLASVLVAAGGVRVLVAAQSDGLLASEGASGINTGSLQAITLDVRALVFTAALTIATGLLFGLLPALQSTRPSLADALSSESATSGKSTRRRINARQALTVLEIAFAVVLLAGSGLLVRSFARLAGIKPGFDPTQVLTMRINRSPDWSRDSIARFYDIVLDRIAQVPGVTSVAIGDCPPLAGGCSPRASLTLYDRPPAPRGAEPVVGVHWITPGWPAVMRVPLVRGRFFSPADGPKSPKVALINEAAARAYWPGENPVGRSFSINQGDTIYIAGVVGDVRYRSNYSPPAPDIYLPYHQQQLSARMMLFMRTSGNPGALAGPVRRAIKEVAPGFPVYEVTTMETRVAFAVESARFSAMLLGLFAGVALVLAALGAYGVVSFAVAQRTREIGVRVALGATSRDVVAMVVRQGMSLAAAGGTIGLVGALATTRLLRAQLYDIEPADPVTLVSIVALLVLAVLVASWIPARRAAGVPAVEALRGG